MTIRRLKVTTANISYSMLEKIEQLVEQGEYTSRSEFFRDACRSRLLELNKIHEDLEYKTEKVRIEKYDKLGNVEHPESYNIIPQAEWNETYKVSK